MRHHRASRDRWRDRTPRAKSRSVLDLDLLETGQSALREGLGRLRPPRKRPSRNTALNFFRAGVWCVFFFLLAPLYLLFNVCKVAARQPSHAPRLKGGDLYMDPPLCRGSHFRGARAAEPQRWIAGAIQARRCEDLFNAPSDALRTQGKTSVPHTRPDPGEAPGVSAAASLCARGQPRQVLEQSPPSRRKPELDHCTPWPRRARSRATRNARAQANRRCRPRCARRSRTR